MLLLTQGLFHSFIVPRVKAMQRVSASIVEGRRKEEAGNSSYLKLPASPGSH
jgi:hypothetical protein